MRAVLVIFIIAFSVSLLSIPWVRKFALRTGFVDAPAQRKLHSAPMPLMGGVGIFIAAVAGVLVFSSQLADSVVGVLLAMTLVAFIGLVDDRYGLPAWSKLLTQLVGVAILIAFDIHIKLPLPTVVNYLLSFLWVAGISNAINFLDNMDGLSAGISGVAAAFILLLGLQNGQFLVSALAAAIVGSTLGFLRYNFKPAKIFMGDAGALFLGFLLALLGLQLRFPENSNFVTWMVPVLILGVPIFDTTLVVFSRLRRGVSPNTPGKDHISHRLVKLGFSQREAVLILYLATGASGMFAVFVTQATILEGYIIFGTLMLAAGIAIAWLERRAPHVV